MSPFPTAATTLLLRLLVGQAEGGRLAIHFLSSAPPALGRRLEASDLAESGHEPYIVPPDEWVVGDDQAVLKYRAPLRPIGDAGPRGWALVHEADGGDVTVITTGVFRPTRFGPADRGREVEAEGTVRLKVGP